MCACEVPGCLPNECPSEPLSGPPEKQVIALQKRIANLCYAASMLCHRIKAEGGHGSEVHRLSESLQSMVDRNSR